MVEERKKWVKVKTQMPTVKTNGITTHYEISGKGQPLVLIHGVSFDHKMWQPQISYFSKKYRVLAYDVRGHGQTESSDGDYSADLLANDLKALLDNLNIQKPIVCGLSMGGLIAKMFAVRYPTQLSALIIADSAVKFIGLTPQEKLLRVLVTTHPLDHKIYY